MNVEALQQLAHNAQAEANSGLWRGEHRERLEDACDPPVVEALCEALTSAQKYIACSKSSGDAASMSNEEWRSHLTHYGIQWHAAVEQCRSVGLIGDNE